jgi:peptide/nickel transport system permease protein
MAGLQFVRVAAGRVATGALTLLLVTVLLFIVVRSIPGGYVNVFLGTHYTPEAAARVEGELGLDRSIVVQYFEWLGHAVQGDLGYSLVTRQPVVGELVQRIPVTAELTLLSLIVAALVGVPLALVAGMTASRPRAEAASRFLGAAALSVPDFVIGTFFVYIFSVYALGLPIGNYVPFGSDPVANLQSMALPALTLGIFGVALVIRTGRDAVAAELGSAHVLAAYSRGMTTFQVMRHHVLRNVTVPLITILGTYTGYLFGGAVVVENLFSLPGVGQYLLAATNNRDYPVISGGVLFAAAAFITINMLIQISYPLIDPRLKRGLAR